MLSIGKLGAGQERYYTERVAGGAEDYYSGRGEAEGYWIGSAAVDLGLDGKVDPEGLTAMLTGRQPATGEPLGLRHVSGRGPVPGFDLTFSAPKSVSLTWALGGEGAGAEVAAAHRASVSAALDYMERQACWTRRGHGGHEFVRGSGFIAAAYLHRSRAPEILSSTPMSSSPTPRVARTGAGPGSTTRRSTTTRRPPATSTRRTCVGS